MSWESKFVGKPFREGGRGPDVYDCWGIVWATYKQILGVILPDYSEIGTNETISVTRQMQESISTGPWLRVAAPQEFDVMVARRDPHSKYPGHVGIMLDANRVLHVWRERDVHISRVAEPTLQGLILGYYRYKTLL